MAIELKEDQERESIAAIQRYFADERDDEIGELQASFLLEFIIQEIGPSIYNQAVRDAQAAMQRAAADLDLNLHETEFAYTAARRTGKNRERP